jgi:hypothetical protein
MKGYKHQVFIVNENGSKVVTEPNDCVSVSKPNIGSYKINFEKMNFASIPIIHVQSYNGKHIARVENVPNNKECLVCCYKTPMLDTSDMSYVILGTHNNETLVDCCFSISITGK